jgi:hypothetical protein
MLLGPVDHQQPDLPPSKNLENFHQGNKVYPEEVDEEGDPTPEFFEAQMEMYQDSTPHRHRSRAGPKASAHRSRSRPGPKAKAPSYSAWIRSDGSLKKCTYIESRQFYCKFYERLVDETPEASAALAKIRKLIDEGTNVAIVGYDSPLEGITVSVEEAYLDPSLPFGHEMVIYTLLTEEPPYPWDVHATEDF